MEMNRKNDGKTNKRCDKDMIENGKGNIKLERVEKKMRSGEIKKRM